MLSVILFILKLIGMILAFVIGSVFFILLLVLVVPIRYKIYVTYEDEIYGEVKVHWLLHMVHFYSSYIDEKLSMRIRILGKIIYDSNKEKKNKDKKKKKKIKREKHKKIADKKNTKNLPHKEEQENIKEEIETKTDAKIKVGEETDKTLPEKAEKQVSEVPVKEEAAKEPKEKQDEQTGQKEQLKEETLIDKRDEDQEEKQTIWDKIKNIFKKIGSIISSLIGLPAKVKEFVLSLFNKVKKQTNRIKEIIKKVKLFIKDEVNRDSFFYTMKLVVKILKHLNPRKLAVKVEFGLDDPAATGMLLGALSALFSFHGKFVRLIPNFNEEVLKAEILAIGRVRIIRLLIIGIRLIFYKNNRQLIKNLKTLKEEL